VIKPYNVTLEGRAAWKAAAHKTVATRRQRDNYVHNNAQRAKLSEAAARQCARGKGVFAPSKIEAQVAAELTKAGVEFACQHVFRDTLGRFSLVADFWLPAVRAVIEVNGTYWHADPRVYPVPVNSMQARCVAKYERKREAYRLLGIQVAEIWEMDLRKSPCEAVLRACQELSISQAPGRVGND
jgi:G:T-mismatch repair DNA endonuclease (very short patch repair protein)